MNVADVRVLMTGIALGESPRWRDGRLWFADWGAQEIIAVDPKGASEVVAQSPSAPFSIDWLPDGRLLFVSGGEGRLLIQEADGSLATYADLAGLSDKPWNELVVDGRGNAYVNTIGFEFPEGEFAPAPSPWSRRTARSHRSPPTSPSPTAWQSRRTTPPSSSPSRTPTS